ncbi:FdtA/QdtA family cupin domain-containing protein [Pontibacter sp. SGAir0037]|uniref:sugar 3,4-ketoisomerase n=1 Tax=Pontibacter sp. SGAir0037 TaxID=2571030 RepID=UPI001F0FE7D1|nr:FdtA/QdtA family cupin domain-containing protein [Pontibacter sp. SGAir0037]
MQQPYLIQFDQIGSAVEGYIATTQYAEKLPFQVKRVFWTYNIPAGVVRGNHANKATQEVLVAVQGAIRVEAEWGKGQQVFLLNSPAIGLYIPPLCWTRLSFQDGAMAVCLTSTDFSEEDYIRDYQEFQTHVTKAFK